MDNLTTTTSEKKDYIFYLEVEKIKPNPYQPRRNFEPESLKELANSIKEYGILEPLVVTRIQKETEQGLDVEYQLIAGGRRLEAAKLIGVLRVPAIIKEIDDAGALAMALIENLQRQDLNPIERARAFARLVEEFRLTHHEVAQRLGKSREFVTNTLRLLKLSSEIQQIIEQGKLSEAHARLLLVIENPEQQKTFLQEILNKELSVKEATEIIKNLENQGRILTSRRLRKQPAPAEAKFLAEKLEEKLGTKVGVKTRKHGGEILIPFHSSEDLSNLQRKLLGEKEL